MATRFNLQMLLDLTRTRTDAAARELHGLKAKWAEAGEKLRQLTEYEKEYRTRLVHGVSCGMTAAAIRDYQLFLGKLAEAIRQQRDEVLRCEKRWELGRQAWQIHQRQLNAYETLALRQHKEQQVVEARREQRDLDEFSRRTLNREE